MPSGVLFCALLEAKTRSDPAEAININHVVGLASLRGHTMEHVPVLHDLAIVIQSEEFRLGPGMILWQLLPALGFMPSVMMPLNWTCLSGFVLRPLPLLHMIDARDAGHLSAVRARRGVTLQRPPRFSGAAAAQIR
jgi:hypothetical protein